MDMRYANGIRCEYVHVVKFKSLKYTFCTENSMNVRGELKSDYYYYYFFW